ncbi:hypothetical protein HJFPF1_00116 [Paramyrothecium foliicola]|nr:hypothetical protein HJFPF1_00116 [Paramyrothecium foliicola]
MKAVTTILNGVLFLTATSQASPMQKRTPQSVGPVAVSSSYKIQAYPSEVVDTSDVKTGGFDGAYAEFTLDLNSGDNSLCYNVTLIGFRGEYESPALTATHLHEAGVGTSGPPRIAFPNPEVSTDGQRYAIGCLTGPFRTGVLNDGIDTGRDFHVGEIEHYPGGFYVDIHSSLAVAGAVRGQLA